MIIMNKLYKCALGLLTAFILSFAGFSSADIIFEGMGGRNDLSAGSTWVSGVSTYDSICISVLVGSPNDSNCTDVTLTKGDTTIRGNGYQHMLCIFGEQGAPSMINHANKTCTFVTQRFDEDDLETYVCTPMSSLECQTEYNLIPISEVTANYCALNFGMIDPQECPINEGTGTIVRSNLMINDVPYAQNQNINVFIPDFLSWNISFNDLYTVIDVEGYNADEEYIENVINQEKLTPTNKDIEDMLTGFMTNYFPYLALAIIFLYLARKIFKLFK